MFSGEHIKKRLNVANTVLFQEGELLASDLKGGSHLTLGNKLSEGTHVLTKQET